MVSFAAGLGLAAGNKGKRGDEGEAAMKDLRFMNGLGWYFRRDCLRARRTASVFITVPIASAAMSRTPVSMPDNSRATLDTDWSKIRYSEIRVSPLFSMASDNHPSSVPATVPDAAENARAAEHDRGDGEQLVADAGIRPRLAEAGDDDHRREPRDGAGDHVGDAGIPGDGHAGVTRAFGGKADGAERAPESGAMHEQPDPAARRRERSTSASGSRRCWNFPSARKDCGNPVYATGAAGERFRESAEERKRAERDDERRQIAAG